MFFHYEEYEEREEREEQKENINSNLYAPSCFRTFVFS